MGPPGTRQQAVRKRQGQPVGGQEVRGGRLPQGTRRVVLDEAVGDDDAYD